MRQPGCSNEPEQSGPAQHSLHALLRVQWWRVLFLHFAIDPAVMRGQLPPGFELELHNGRAIATVVALTKRRFRPCPGAAWWTRFLPLIREQRLLNLRTYARNRDERGAFFFWSWMSRPFGLPLPSRPLGLTCAFARPEFRHEHETGSLDGRVSARGKCFAYTIKFPAITRYTACAAGSLSEFALERYTAFYWHRGSGRVFHAAHAPWLQTTACAEVQERSLVEARFPWFREAQLLEANYAPGLDEVSIGSPQRVQAVRFRSHHGPSALFEMP